jgi:hypothetical protein
VNLLPQLLEPRLGMQVVEARVDGHDHHPAGVLVHCPFERAQGLRRVAERVVNQRELPRRDKRRRRKFAQDASRFRLVARQGVRLRSARTTTA